MKSALVASYAIAHSNSFVNAGRLSEFKDTVADRFYTPAHNDLCANAGRYDSLGDRDIKYLLTSLSEGDVARKIRREMAELEGDVARKINNWEAVLEELKAGASANDVARMYGPEGSHLRPERRGESPNPKALLVLGPKAPNSKAYVTKQKAKDYFDMSYDDSVLISGGVYRESLDVVKAIRRMFAAEKCGYKNIDKYIDKGAQEWLKESYQEATNLPALRDVIISHTCSEKVGGLSCTDYIRDLKKKNYQVSVLLVLAEQSQLDERGKELGTFDIAESSGFQTGFDESIKVISDQQKKIQDAGGKIRCVFNTFGKKLDPTKKAAYVEFRKNDKISMFCPGKTGIHVLGYDIRASIPEPAQAESAADAGPRSDAANFGEQQTPPDPQQHDAAAGASRDADSSAVAGSDSSDSGALHIPSELHMPPDPQQRDAATGANRQAAYPAAVAGSASANSGQLQISSETQTEPVQHSPERSQQDEPAKQPTFRPASTSRSSKKKTRGTVAGNGNAANSQFMSMFAVLLLTYMLLMSLFLLY